MANTDESTPKSVNATRNRKRVEAVTNATLKRAKNGSAFTRWYRHHFRFNFCYIISIHILKFVKSVIILKF